MYWYKQPRSLTLLGCLLAMLCFAGCKPEQKQNGSAQYFDLKKYFTAEAARMQKLHHPVLKKVNYNNQPEQKTVLIKNWARELDLFIQSDINKPAWRDSYRTVINNGSVTYTAIDTNLNTREINIVLNRGIVKAVHITNFTINILYQTKENLTYYPDSLYRIEKKQAVKIMGANNYEVTGLLGK